jgi:hypothetical protein
MGPLSPGFVNDWAGYQTQPWYSPNNVKSNDGSYTTSQSSGSLLCPDGWPGNCGHEAFTVVDPGDTSYLYLFRVSGSIPPNQPPIWFVLNFVIHTLIASPTKWYVGLYTGTGQYVFKSSPIVTNAIGYWTLSVGPVDMYQETSNGAFWIAFSRNITMTPAYGVGLTGVCGTSAFIQSYDGTWPSSIQPQCNGQVGSLDSIQVYVDYTMTDYLNTNSFGFNIPTNATINGVVLTAAEYASSKTTNEYVTDAVVSLVSSGGQLCGSGAALVSPGSKWNDTRSFQTRGSPMSTWGCPLTPQMVDSVYFGISYSAMIFSENGGMVTAHVDWIGLTIYYTIPHGTTITTTGTIGCVNYDNFDGPLLNSIWTVSSNATASYYELTSGVYHLNPDSFHVWINSTNSVNSNAYVSLSSVFVAKTSTVTTSYWIYAYSDILVYSSTYYIYHEPGHTLIDSIPFWIGSSATWESWGSSESLIIGDTYNITISLVGDGAAHAGHYVYEYIDEIYIDTGCLNANACATVDHFNPPSLGSWWTTWDDYGSSGSSQELTASLYHNTPDSWHTWIPGSNGEIRRHLEMNLTHTGGQWFASFDYYWYGVASVDNPSMNQAYYEELILTDPYGEDAGLINELHTTPSGWQHDSLTDFHALQSGDVVHADIYIFPSWQNGFYGTTYYPTPGAHVDFYVDDFGTGGGCIQGYTITTTTVTTTSSSSQNTTRGVPSGLPWCTYGELGGTPTFPDSSSLIWNTGIWQQGPNATVSCIGQRSITSTVPANGTRAFLYKSNDGSLSIVVNSYPPLGITTGANIFASGTYDLGMGAVISDLINADGYAWGVIAVKNSTQNSLKFAIIRITELTSGGLAVTVTSTFSNAFSVNATGLSVAGGSLSIISDVQLFPNNVAYAAFSFANSTIPWDTEIMKISNIWSGTTSVSVYDIYDTTGYEQPIGVHFAYSPDSSKIVGLFSAIYTFPYMDSGPYALYDLTDMSSRQLIASGTANSKGPSSIIYDAINKWFVLVSWDSNAELETGVLQYSSVGWSLTKGTIADPVSADSGSDLYDVHLIGNRCGLVIVFGLFSDDKIHYTYSFQGGHPGTWQGTSHYTGGVVRDWFTAPSGYINELPMDFSTPDYMQPTDFATGALGYGSIQEFDRNWVISRFWQYLPVAMTYSGFGTTTTTATSTVLITTGLMLRTTIPGTTTIGTTYTTTEIKDIPTTIFIYTMIVIFSMFGAALAIDRSVLSMCCGLSLGVTIAIVLQLIPAYSMAAVLLLAVTALFFSR